jgi:hypothetical protein
MRLKTITALALGAVLFVAPHAFAMGGGGGRGGNGSSGTGGGGTFSVTGTAENGTVTGSFTGGSGSGVYSGTFDGTYRLNAAEPFTTLAVGLGLLGAGYLRRRHQ